MGYFAPPSHENWRMVDVTSTERRLRIVWIAPMDLATTWRVATTSVVAERVRTDEPDLTEAISVGLLPPWTDGELVIGSKMFVGGNWFFACRGRHNHAYPDFTAVVRLRLDENLLMGITCRVRPPCFGEDTGQLLDWIGSAIEEWFEEPIPSASDPTRDAERGPILAPHLQRLDEAEEDEDHVQAAEILDLLRPYLQLAPMSRFALNIHITEGWVEKRRAFSGETGAASRAIEILGKVMDSIDVASHPDLVRVASLWLAQSYSKRDEPGDLLRAIMAYGTVIRLDESAGSRRASMHFQTGILHRVIGQRLKESPEQVAEHAALAMEQFALAEQIYQSTNSLSGRIETSIAKADLIRLLTGVGAPGDAADLYLQAWSLMVEPGGQSALGTERFERLCKHVFLCMTELDEAQFAPSPAPQAGDVRALGLFLRPLTMTRKLEFRRPAGPPTDASGRPEGAVSLEIALARALSPDVFFTYVGGAMHPLAASMMATASAKADWQLAVKLQIRDRDLVMLVPGYTPGMQWELRFLTEERLLERTLLIMIPSDTDLSAAGVWEGARNGALAFGLRLPPYSDSGGFIRLNNQGIVIRQLAFEAIWKPGELLAAISDILPTPEEMSQRARKAQEMCETLPDGENLPTVKRIRAGLHERP